jgi:hypothetical protein
MIDTTALIQNLCKNTFTVGDMRRRLGLLQESVEFALFDNKTTDTAAAIKATIAKRGTDEDVVAVTAWGDGVFAVFTSSNIRKYILALQEAVDMLPVMTMYIPVAFPETELADMAIWCREQCAPQLLFDVRIDPQVAGGCAFVWNDTYHDFSFLAQSKKYPRLITEQLNTYV